MTVEPQGDFTYFDENRYPVTEALDIFNDNLMTMGQIIVRDGNRLTLLNASAEIPGNIIPFVPIHGIDALGRNELATVAIPLRNTDPIQALDEIRQLQSPMGQVKALTNSGRMIVTDTGSYLRRMRDLLLGSGVAAGDGQAYVYPNATGANATWATQNDPTGGGAAGNNMVMVTQNEYDNGVAGRDGNLTLTKAWGDGNTNRQTQFSYDFRNRQISVLGEENTYSETTYDNLNRPLLRQTRTGSSAGSLLSKSQTDYDNRGRVFRSTIWGVHADTGVITVPLVSDT
jgi:type II secretory pathway component GspD/PulD (secretin)